MEIKEKEIIKDKSHSHSDCNLVKNGHKSITILNSAGKQKYPRQVLYCKDCNTDIIPINSCFPEHKGEIILDDFKEICCLFANDIPYEQAKRLLGYCFDDKNVISAHGIENIVMKEGEKIREKTEKAVQKATGEDIKNKFNPKAKPRNNNKWPEEVKDSIKKAINNLDNVEKPNIISISDWERIKTQINLKTEEKTDSDIEELLKLGPQIKPGELLIFIDGILVNNWNEPKYLEHSIAAIATIEGIRYLSGTNIVNEIGIWVEKINPESITVVADGAKDIEKELYNGVLEKYKNKVMILDWYHLTKKSNEMLSMICKGKKHKESVFSELTKLLWNGNTESALEILMKLQGRCRNENKLNEFIKYINHRKAYIPNYQERRNNCQYTGSAIVEKANDILVARRQKNKCMQWTRRGGDALLALKTLQKNNEWDEYWTEKKIA